MDFRLTKRQSRLPSLRARRQQLSLADADVTCTAPTHPVLDLPLEGSVTFPPIKLGAVPLELLLCPFRQASLVRGPVIYTLDDTLCVTSISAAWQRGEAAAAVRELVRSQVVGTALPDHLPESLSQRWSDMCRQLIAQGHLDDGRLEYGEEIAWPSPQNLLRLSFTCCDGPSGLPTSLNFSVLDITAQGQADKQALHQRDELSLLYAIGTAISDGHTLTELGTAVLRAVARAIGSDRGALYLVDDSQSQVYTSQPLASYGNWPRRWPRPNQAILQVVAQYSISMGTVVVSQPIENAGRSPIHLLSVPLVTDTERVGAIVLIRPSNWVLTSDHLPMLAAAGTQIAGALAQATRQERLKERVAQLHARTQWLELGYLDLDAAFKARELFMRNLMHDLRSALATLLSDAQLDQERQLGKTKLSMYDALTRIVDEVKALVSRLDNRVSIQKIDRGLLQVAPSNLAELLAASADRVARHQDHRQMAPAVSVEKNLPQILMDSTRIGQALDNLLDHTVRWSPQGSSIQISAQRAISEPDQILVSIVADGIDTAPPALEEIHRHFHQVDESAVTQVGVESPDLAIAKRVVEMHGGRFWVNAQRQNGSAIHFTLPMAAVQLSYPA